MIVDNIRLHFASDPNQKCVTALITDDAHSEPTLLGKLHNNKWLFYEPKYESIFWKVVREMNSKTVKRNLHTEMVKLQANNSGVYKWFRVVKNKIIHKFKRRYSYIYINVVKYIALIYIKLICLMLLCLMSFAVYTSQTDQNYTISYTTTKESVNVLMDKHLTYYSHYYNIPQDILYGVAFYETGYMGIHHNIYNHRQISNTGALGPMQVLLSTAREVNKDNVSLYKLQSDIEYNISTSAKYLSQLHHTYGSWEVALGYYNTGYPIINDYATKITKFKKI